MYYVVDHNQIEPYFRYRTRLINSSPRAPRAQKGGVVNDSGGTKYYFSRVVLFIIYLPKNLRKILTCPMRTKVKMEQVPDRRLKNMPTMTLVWFSTCTCRSRNSSPEINQTFDIVGIHQCGLGQQVFNKQPRCYLRERFNFGAYFLKPFSFSETFLPDHRCPEFRIVNLKRATLHRRHKITMTRREKCIWTFDPIDSPSYADSAVGRFLTDKYARTVAKMMAGLREVYMVSDFKLIPAFNFGDDLRTSVPMAIAPAVLSSRMGTFVLDPGLLMTETVSVNSGSVTLLPVVFSGGLRAVLWILSLHRL
ncbi:hypothetical protein IW262DRAFT_1302651 [Armillaria fumosa]|nr:hypothetical protein IW262DRAFT_1302651 [Armillaria fumosa]